MSHYKYFSRNIFKELFDLFSRSHLLRTFFNIQPGEGSHLDGA